jgi:hypothetical protein
MIEFKILEKTPTCARDKTHHYCDYIELVTLCEGVDGISNSDIYNRYYEDERIRDIGSEDGAESNESWVSEIDTWFEELRAREIAYGEKYPFTISGNRFSINQDLDDNQLIYIGLLLCSLLRYIENSHKFSSAFEFASLCAMKEYLPQVAEVHIFGVSSRNAGRYTGSLESKIRLLSEDLNFPLSTRPNVFRQGDNGDGGIDIIAWLPFCEDTNLDKKLMFVGQSAATMDWGRKQASVDRLMTYLNIETTPLNVLYVPYDMRDSDRNIRDWTLVTTDLLFDRHRMLQLLNPDQLFSGELGTEFKQLIESAVELEVDILGM